LVSSACRFRSPARPDTSGCLLLARNPKAHKRFQRAFEEKKVLKTYVAVLDGVPDAESGEIDLALGKTSTKEGGWRMVPDIKGKPALTAGAGSPLRTVVRYIASHLKRAARSRSCPMPRRGIGIPDRRRVPSTGRARADAAPRAFSAGWIRGDRAPVEATAPAAATFIAAGYER
jgi:tRNA pseudouridine32 synthase/23S rRNA pseudouridine746 synthase